MNEFAVASLVVLAVVSVLWTVMMVMVTSELRRASWRLPSSSAPWSWI